MRKVFIRSPYNYDADEVSRETALNCSEESDRTQQQFREEADINTIVRRFGVTQMLPTTFKPPMTGDFTEVTDFHTAMNAVRSAEESFMQLPAHMRVRFGHDPQKMIDFLGNPENREEAIKLGMMNKPPEPTRDVVTAVDELAAKIVPRETK